MNGNENPGWMERARERFGLTGNGLLGLGAGGRGLAGFGLLGASPLVDIPSMVDDVRTRFGRQPAAMRLQQQQPPRPGGATMWGSEGVGMSEPSLDAADQASIDRTLRGDRQAGDVLVP